MNVRKTVCSYIYENVLRAQLTFLITKRASPYERDTLLCPKSTYEWRELGGNIHDILFQISELEAQSLFVAEIRMW
jgi:hypothetical protein